MKKTERESLPSLSFPCSDASPTPEAAFYNVTNHTLRHVLLYIIYAMMSLVGWCCHGHQKGRQNSSLCCVRLHCGHQ